MNEQTIREAVEAHAQAVVHPMDAARVQSDLIEELHPQLAQLAGALPQPVTSAEVSSLSIQDGHADAVITYHGENASLSIASRWEDRGAGRPQVVSAAPQG